MEPAAKESRLDSFIEKPRRAVWILAVPMMGGFLAHALYHAVDAIFIGMLGAEALAAATFVGALFFVAGALSIGFATGVTANVAQAIGRRDRQGAERLAADSLGVGLFMGLALAGVGLIFGRDMMPLLGAEGETASLAWQYFQIICFGMPLMFVSAVFRSVLTGEGDARTPMTIIMLANVLNLALDPLFIFTLGMGIRGAAVATVTAQLLALATFAYIVFVRRRSHVRFKLALTWPRMEVIAPVVSIGLPAAANQLIMSLGMGLGNRVVAVFGQTAVAGYGAGFRVDMMVVLPILAVASATMSVVGMFAGAGRLDLVRSTVIYAYRWGVVIALIFGVGAYVGAGSIISLFTDHPHALEVGRMHLGYMVFAYPLMAFGITSGRILQGLGHGMPPLVITGVRVLVIGIPGAYVAVYLFDAPIDAVWLAHIAGGVLANIMAVLWVRSQVWKRDPTLRATGK